MKRKREIEFSNPLDLKRIKYENNLNIHHESKEKNIDSKSKNDYPFIPTCKKRIFSEMNDYPKENDNYSILENNTIYFNTNNDLFLQRKRSKFLTFPFSQLKEYRHNQEIKWMLRQENNTFNTYNGINDSFDFHQMNHKLYELHQESLKRHDYKLVEVENSKTSYLVNNESKNETNTQIPWFLCLDSDSPTEDMAIKNETKTFTNNLSKPAFNTTQNNIITNSNYNDYGKNIFQKFPPFNPFNCAFQQFKSDQMLMNES